MGKWELISHLNLSSSCKIIIAIHHSNKQSLPSFRKKKNPNQRSRNNSQSSSFRRICWKVYRESRFKQIDIFDIICFSHSIIAERNNTMMKWQRERERRRESKESRIALQALQLIIGMRQSFDPKHNQNWRCVLSGKRMSLRLS